MPDFQELDAMLARLVDETISPDELADLERRLDGDPDAQRRYLHYLDLHSDLAEGKGATRTEKSAPMIQRRGWLISGLAAAAAVCIGAFIILNSNGPAPVIRVVDSDGPVRWLDDGGKVDSAIVPGREFPNGTLEALTPDSWAELEFSDGTSLSLAGQSAVTVSVIEGQKVIRVREGQLSIDAAKQPAGRPLRVITPSAEAEVLGTQFNVKADEFSARFVVNEGLVRVTRLADGQVEEVAADQVVVAALERNTEFSAAPRRAFVETWKSQLPRDQLQGRWEPQPAGLRAIPHLWKGDTNDPVTPVLLYSAVLDPSKGTLPPVRLAGGTRVVVRGKIDRAESIHLGFGTNRRRGGFVGKYSLPGGIKATPNKDGRFELDLSLEDFKPTRKRFPSSPVGHEIDWLWVQTVKVDAGLVVESVELKR